MRERGMEGGRKGEMCGGRKRKARHEGMNNEGGTRDEGRRRMCRMDREGRVMKGGKEGGGKEGDRDI